ncbi:MAG: PQQ-binding-like beta-propeller repeat protein [Planctomycetales bacterium]|nr:PQQ-binding-like beta-propeller repeat protein [Planctomycetales bacterium]
MLVRTLLRLQLMLLTAAVAVGSAYAESAVSALVPRDVALRQGLVWGWARQLPMSPTFDEVNNVQVDGNEVFVTTKRGLVLAIDGETGRAIWTVRVKDPESPTTDVGFDANYVAVVNDSRVYVLRRATGESVMEKKLARAQGGAPSVGAGRVWVPAFDGMMSSWEIEDADRPDKDTAKRQIDHKVTNPAFVYNSGSEIDQPAIISDTGASWATMRGEVFSIELKDRRSRYRFDAGSRVYAPLTHFAPNLFVVTADGFAYAIDEATGKMNWRFSSGSIVRHPLVGMRDIGLVITESGDMHVIEVSDGLERDVVPGVRQFVAASPDRWYLLGLDGLLHVVDPATARSTRTIDVTGFDWLAMNTYNDRIYMGTSGGMTQCLHEIALEEPVLLEPPMKKENADAAAAEGDASTDAGAKPDAGDTDATDDVGDDADNADNENPFAGEDN